MKKRGDYEVKILYLDCSMGASGDMLMGALYGLLDEDSRKIFHEKIDSLDLAGTTLTVERMQKRGIGGYKASVLIHGEEESHHTVTVHDHSHPHPHHDHTHDHNHDDGTKNHSEEKTQAGEHGHRSFREIEGILQNLDISERTVENARSIYRIIAEAESTVHGTTVDQIHFHEVGELDAIMDIVGNCLLMEMISPDRIVSSPVSLGSGTVRCAHGILPVPAPATSLIIEGMEISSTDEKGELLTPTGAAILRHFVQEFSTMPSMKVTGSSFGFGTKEFRKLNAVRAFLGSDSDSEDKPVNKEIEKETDIGKETEKETIYVVETNIDDMTPEMMAGVMENLAGQGALDSWLTQVIMKKGRPGYILSALVQDNHLEELVRYILKETTTIGVRYTPWERCILRRQVVGISTSEGDFRVKISGEGIFRKAKPEYEDVALLSKKKDISLNEASRYIMNEYEVEEAVNLTDNSVSDI